MSSERIETEQSLFRNILYSAVYSTIYVLYTGYSGFNNSLVRKKENIIMTPCHFVYFQQLSTPNVNQDILYHYKHIPYCIIIVDRELIIFS